MVRLNSPPLNFPHTTATNLFLIESNYARAFQDAEKTNRRSEPRWNEAPLYCIALLAMATCERLLWSVVAYQGDMVRIDPWCYSDTR